MSFHPPCLMHTLTRCLQARWQRRRSSAMHTAAVPYAHAQKTGYTPHATHKRMRQQLLAWPTMACNGVSSSSQHSRLITPAVALQLPCQETAQQSSAHVAAQLRLDSPAMQLVASPARITKQQAKRKPPR